MQYSFRREHSRSRSRNDDDLLSSHPEPSYPAQAGYPVRRGFSVQTLTSLGYWITRMRG